MRRAVVGLQCEHRGKPPPSARTCPINIVAPDPGDVNSLEECHVPSPTCYHREWSVVLVTLAIAGDALLPLADAYRGIAPCERVRHSLASVFSIAEHHDLLITHGHVAMNPPDPSPFAYDSEIPFTLDLASAQTQGVMGYYLAQAFAVSLPETHVVSLLTQTEVSASDPAFHEPDVFVGPALAASTAHRLEVDRGWHVRTDGAALRRVVPALDPVGICELPSIKHLVDIGTLVICAGNGGIPVLRDENGHLRGIDAIVRRELAASYLASAVEADVLLLLGGDDYVLNTPPGRDGIRDVVPETLRGLAHSVPHARSTIEAAARFVESTGRPAMIGPLDQAEAVLAGHCGTLVHA